MMNKKRTREIGRTKYLMFLPLAALLMIISNIEAVARTTKEMAKDVIEAVEENLASNSTTPEMEVATETAPLETPAPQQDKDKLVNYKGVVVDKDGKQWKALSFSLTATTNCHKVNRMSRKRTVIFLSKHSKMLK